MLLISQNFDLSTSMTSSMTSPKIHTAFRLAAIKSTPGRAQIAVPADLSLPFPLAPSVGPWVRGLGHTWVCDLPQRVIYLILPNRTYLAREKGRKKKKMPSPLRRDCRLQPLEVMTSSQEEHAQQGPHCGPFLPRGSSRYGVLTANHNLQFENYITVS